MKYSRCGDSGVLLPKVSLGFWHNFGETTPYERSREIALAAFDRGVTHFDLANNYGPEPGHAESRLGQLLREDLKSHRDELFISTKAAYDMWEGPYGSWASRKHMMASLDQSLQRMGLEYVDLFYCHRYDPATPLIETLQTLVDIVRQGKALYIGLSRWPLNALKFGLRYLHQHDVPVLIYQGRLNMLDRGPEEEGILAELEKHGVPANDDLLWGDAMNLASSHDASSTNAQSSSNEQASTNALSSSNGLTSTNAQSSSNGQTSLDYASFIPRPGFISFSPLAQGLLTDRYLHGIPVGSRMTEGRFLKSSVLTRELQNKLLVLNDMAEQRGESLAQMALAWILQHKAVTSVLIGASSVGQLDQNLMCIDSVAFTDDELLQIDRILGVK